jgi:hypothetical protein
MADALFIATALFLLAFFLAAEAFRLKQGRPGRLVSFLREENPAAGMIRSRVLVRMESGEEVEAMLPACVLCLGRLREGDRVVVNRSRGEYLVGLSPLIGRGRGKASGPETGCRGV